MTDLVLRLKLTADGSGVVQAVGGAEVAVKRLGDEARRTESEAGRLNSSLGNLSRGFGLFATAISAIGLGALARSALDYADSIKRLSSEFNLTTTAVQEFRYIANITGQDIDKLLNSLRKQSTLITEAAEGNKKAAEFMNKLHLSAKAMLGLNLDQQTELIGRAILNLGTTTEQTAAATEAWAKSATGMLAILRE